MTAQQKKIDQIEELKVQKGEIEDILNFIGQFFIEHYTQEYSRLTECKCKGIIRDKLNQVLDIYEAMKPEVLHQTVLFVVYGMKVAWKNTWMELSWIWLRSNPEGYVENETDKRIDATFLEYIQSLDWCLQTCYYDMKAGIEP